MYRFNKNTLSFDKINLNMLILFCTILPLSISISLSYYFTKKVVEKDKESHLLILKGEVNEFTPEKFYNYLKQINVKFPKLVYGKAKKECGFNSPIFKENNNLFSMKDAGLRPQIKTGMNRGHCTYENWEQSCIDYALYQSYFLREIKTESQFIEYLKTANYFDSTKTDTGKYIRDIISISKETDKFD